MTIKVSALAVAALLVSAPAFAQEPRVEIGASYGYTLSDGVSGNAIRAGDGNVYNAVGPKDSSSWGLTLGYFLTENWALEFQYDQQKSTLEFSGTAVREVGDYAIKTYHGAFVYNGGRYDDKLRPFVFLGGGATSYPGLTFTAINNQQREIGGNTQFSGTAGAGVKIYASKNVGLKLQARWVPTYIKSDSTGYWCDPYWGCYVTGDAQYSNQFEFSGGLTLRF